MISIGLKRNSRGVNPPQQSLTGTSDRVQPRPYEPPHADEAVIRCIQTTICPAIDTSAHLFLVIIWDIPLRQTRLSLTVLSVTSSESADRIQDSECAVPGPG